MRHLQMPPELVDIVKRLPAESARRVVQNQIPVLAELPVFYVFLVLSL